MLVDIIMTIGSIVLLIWLWPVIKWGALIFLALTLFFGLRISHDAKKVTEEIKKDPQAYYGKQVEEQKEEQHD